VVDPLAQGKDWGGRRRTKSRATFGEAAAEWLRFVEFDRRRRRSTVRDYHNNVRFHLIPEFGAETVLTTITYRRIDAYRERLVEEDVLAPRTINKLLTNLHGVFRRAMRVYDLENNPVALIDKQPCRASGDFRVLAPREVLRLIGAAATEQDRAIYALAAFAGLRMGELRALRWSDVDFTLSTIHVRRSFSLGRFEPPKSGRVRSVPLIEQVAERLSQLQRRDSPDDLIFTAQKGGVIDDSRVRRRFYDAYTRAGLQPLRFHDLRHSFGTMAVQAFPLSEVAAFMGHAAIETTMIYVHHVPKQDAASKLARVVDEQARSKMPPARIELAHMV